MSNLLSSFTPGGGGSNFTVRIPLLMEVLDGVVGLPDIHALATQTSKLSSMVLPHVGSDSALNLN